MDILNSFYAFLGGGDVVKGSQYFNMFLAGLVFIIIVIIIACIAISIINNRKRKNVTLKSAKSEKIREKRARGVFNYDSEGRFIGDEDEPENDQDEDQQPRPPVARKRRKTDNKAVIDMVRRSHSDQGGDNERTAPQISLKPVPPRPAAADDTSAPASADQSRSTEADRIPAMGDDDTDARGYDRTPSSPSMSMNGGQQAKPTRMPHHQPANTDPRQNTAAANRQPQPMPATPAQATGIPAYTPAPMQPQPHAVQPGPRQPADQTDSMIQHGQQARQTQNNDSGPKHARHARNPFSRPVSAEDIEGGRQ